MKKVLILASVASMIDQFNIPNIKLLQELGYQVDVACNFNEGNTCSDERIEELKHLLKKINVEFFNIEFARNITSIGRNMKAFSQVKALLKNKQYDFLHCHSPIGGVVGRLAGKKQHVKVIYTAHGFHFFKHAPLKNWLIYYPVEKWLSRFTDVLITINSEDFTFAKKKMKAKRIEYIPGVGVDLSRFGTPGIDDNLNRAEMDTDNQLRTELGIGCDDMVLLSVGELNSNKNHMVVINALAEILKLDNKKNIHYIIVGKGEKKEELENLSRKLDISDNVHLIGFRNNISDWYKMADIFVMPSKREGLSVALMEAMASGLPCVVSDIRGNRDLIDDANLLFVPVLVEECVGALGFALGSDLHDYGEKNRRKVKQFSVKAVMDKMRDIYFSV